MNDEQQDHRDFFQNVDSIPSSMAVDTFDRLNHTDSQSSMINNPLQIHSRPYSSQSNFIEPSSSGISTADYYQYQHSRTSSFSSSTSSLSNQPQIAHSNHNRKSLSHKRTRSVDLRLSTSSNPSLLSSQSSLSATTSQSSIHFLSTIEEKVSKLYYKHGLFCSRHPALIISFSLMIVFITSYQIFTFRGVFGSSYDLYISSSFKSHDSFLLNSGDNSVHPLMKHFNYWPDSYVRNELDDDQNVPPWFQPNLSYAYVQQIYIRSAVIPWPQDMQLVDALRAPFETTFEIVEAVSNFQFKNDFNEPITLNDVCFQVFEPTFSEHYSQIASHLSSYSCLTLSPANVWHGDRTKFLQDQNFLNTLLKFQDLPASPVPSGALHDIIFGVSFEDTGIRRTYGRNRVRTITYAITLILRENSPEFIEALRAYLYKRYPLSTTIMNNKNSRNEHQSTSSATNRNHYEFEPQIAEPVDLLENKTKHIYFHTTFTYNYLLPLILIYAMACFYMYYIVRKVEIIFNKRLYSLCTLITLLMSLFMSFGICFRLRFHSVLIVNRLLPYFVAGISFENMLVLTKSVLANPHLDSKVRVAQVLSKEGLSITKNLLAELAFLSIGSFTLMPFFQECCKIAAVCFLSDFFIQLTLFTPFYSLLVQRIKKRNIHAYPKKHPQNVYPRNIYARPGEPIQQKTPKRLRFILFLARLRLVQRGFILLLSACIGSAIYNAYLVLEQTTTPLENSILNQKQSFSSSKPNSTMSQKFESESEITTNFIPVTTINETVLIDKNSQKSFMKLLEIDKISTFSKDDKETINSSSPPPTINAYHRLSYSSRSNSMPKPFANQHWTNLFSLYNISLTGRFISILPPILLSVPITPERAKLCRNAADSDYHKLKKFIPMKFSNGEYVIRDDDDYDKFEQVKLNHWSKDDLHLIIGLWTPCFILFIYLIIQLYRCMCTRNYAEWRTQLSETNPFQQLGSLVKRAASLKNHNDGTNGNSDRLLRIDISILNYDREKEAYTNEKQYFLDNQDIDLIATNLQTPLVAASSLSGDLRMYDALTCESLAIIKRSNYMMNDSSSSIFPYKPSRIIDEMLTNVDDNYEKQNASNGEAPVVIKTEGNILKTLFYGIQNDDVVSNCEDDNLDDHHEYLEFNNDRFKSLDFRPIWCMDIYDKYVLLGCGGDDGRFEVWDAYTGCLSFVYYPDAYRNANEDFKKPNDSYAITVIKSTYWAVALARLNGQLEILELDQFKEDKYSTIFQPDTSSSQTKCHDQINYRLKFRIQAHKQPITRVEIIDSLEDDEFIRVFGSRGCLISGSMDTTLKVFALDNFKLMYTLNGHCGAIMTTAIDPYSTASALSGCQLGQMCVWDLNTGTCIFSMQAHSDAEVLSIVTSPLYFVTSGTDNTICIWDRYSGHLIHRIPNQHTICRSMVFLEPFILVTVRDNELIIWDCNDARSICMVPLASHTTDIDSSTGNQMALNNNENKWTKSYQASSIKNLVFSFEQKALICDYGNLLCVMNNPFATRKID